MQILVKIFLTFEDFQLWIILHPAADIVPVFFTSLAPAARRPRRKEKHIFIFNEVERDAKKQLVDSVLWLETTGLSSAGQFAVIVRGEDKVVSYFINAIQKQDCHIKGNSRNTV